MAFDANVVIGVLTLLVTCAPGVLFLLRLRSRHREIKENATATVRILILDAVRVAIPIPQASHHISFLFASAQPFRFTHLVSVESGFHPANSCECLIGVQ